MVRDALIILRAGIQRGEELPDRTASFELWSDTVRRAVCFVGNMDMIDVDDPVKSIEESFSMDPETMKLGTLMSAWAEVFRERAIKSAELITAATEGRETSDGFTYIRPELHAAVDEIAGKGRSINARILGRWIEKHRDRIVWDLKIVEAGESHRAKLWKVIGA